MKYKEEQREKNLIISLKHENGNVYTDKTEIANHCNDFFSTIVNNFEKMNTSNHDFNYERTPNSFVYNLTNEIEAKNAILDLKPKKSPGSEEIKVDTLKAFIDYITEPLIFITNKFLETVIFPAAYKRLSATNLQVKK